MKKIFALGIVTLSLAGNAHAYYQAEQGRWLNRDPLQEKGGNNLYVFIANNPVNFIDLYGLDPVGEQIKGQYMHDWWWQLRPWDDPDEIFSIEDGSGNTMATETRQQMDNYYKSLLAGKILTECWEAYEIKAGDTGRSWWVFRKKYMDRKEAGFWLNRTDHVEVTSGSFEYRKNPDSGDIEVRNAAVSYKWFDRIDCNPSRGDPFGFYVLESVNSACEWITGADFDIEITWEDNRGGPWEVD